MAKTDVILIVGDNQVGDVYGFNAVAAYTFGSFIPNELEGVLVKSLEVDESAGSVVLALPSNVYSDTVGIKLQSGETIDLTNSGGTYTAGTTDTDFTDVIVACNDGVCNMVIEELAIFSSAGTTSATTIDVTLDTAPSGGEVATEWTVEINGTTNNVVTDVSLTSAVMTVTVTDDIIVGQTITVSHVYGSGIATITDATVTNNEV